MSSDPLPPLRPTTDTPKTPRALNNPKEPFTTQGLCELIVPDARGQYYRSKLISWAKKLVHLLDSGWTVAEIKGWSQGRWQTANPGQWPPSREDWTP